MHVNNTHKNMYSFYIESTCIPYEKLTTKQKNAFKYCQKNKHGITMPKYYPNKFNFRYNVYVRHNVNNINTYYRYTKLSCDALLEVIQELFKNVFKNVDTIYYKGGEFEKKYFKQFTSDIVKIVDIGIFDIEKYISKLGTINNLCHQ